MPNINDAFPSHYLKASDLQGNQAVVTIDRVEFEAVGREKDQKAILYFIGKKKGVVLNKTNARKICEIAGSALTEEWHGVAIVLYPTETEYAGDTVECIRVKGVNKAKMQRMTPAAPVVTAPPPPVFVPPLDEAPDGMLNDDEISFAWLMPLILPLVGLIGSGLLAS